MQEKIKKFTESSWGPATVAVLIMVAFITVGYIKAVTSTTTIGTNISTGGTLTVSGAAYASSTLLLDGASTFNGNNTFGNAATDVNLFTGTLQASTTALFTGAVTLYNATTTLADGTTISSGSMSGTTLRSMYVVLKDSAVTTGVTQHKLMEIDGTFGDTTKPTYGLVAGFSRDAATTVDFSGLNTDTGLDLRVTNDPPGNAAGYKLQGAFIKAKNDGHDASVPLSGVLSTLKGLYVEAQNEYNATVTTLTGIDIGILADGTETTGTALNIQSLTGRDRTAAINQFTDISLQYGETIDNKTNGKITFDGNYSYGGTMLYASTTEATAAVDSTRYYDFEVQGYTDPAASAEVTGLYGAYNWRAGTNGTFIVNAVEGVARIQGADESGTFRGVYGRTYIDPAYTGATARTSVGGEFSARASYSGGTTIAAESGTAFIGSRIWMAPYFSAATLGNLTNFWGLWIYGEHATQNNASSSIKVSDAGGGWDTGIDFSGGTYDVAEIKLKNSETISNATNGTITATGKLAVAATRLTDGTGAGTSDFLEKFIDVDVDLTGIGTATAKGNTYLMNLSGWRSDNVVNDQGQDDVGLKIAMDNHATNNAASYILRGMDVKARNKHEGSDVGRIEGAYITAENEDGNTSALTSSIVGVYANAKNGNSTNFVGEVEGLKVENQSSATTGTNYGLVVTLSSEAQSLAKDSAMVIQGTGTAGSWNYGLDMNGATINTAAIRLQNGVTISTGGTLTHTAACAPGSLYLETNGGAGVLHVCTGSGNWDTVNITSD